MRSPLISKNGGPLDHVSIPRNLAFGLTASIWSALIGLAVVPIYLKSLGVEAYGLIGVYSSAAALFSLLDFGLAPAINREVARSTAQGNMHPARELLHTLAVVYWSMAFAIMALMMIVAPVVAKAWLNTRHLPETTITTSLMLIGLAIACRWPHSLYVGALIGAERLALVSVISMFMSLLGSGGAVAVLVWITPDIEAFFLWQCVVGMVHVVVLRAAAWRVLGRGASRGFSTDALRGIWRFSAGSSGVAVTALLLTQIDKVILSGVLSLAAFGEYTLATVVVSAIYLAVNPVFNVIYPRFTMLVASRDEVTLQSLYRIGTQVFAATLFPVCMVIAVFSEEIVAVWTGSREIAGRISLVVALLAAGSALHSVMYFPYALQLAYGLPRMPLQINLLLLAIAVPAIAVLSWLHGAIGGAAAWFLLFTVYLLLGAWMTHRVLLVGLGAKWLLVDVGRPLAIALSAGIVGRIALNSWHLSSFGACAVAVVLVVACWGASWLIAPRGTLTGLLRLLRT